MFSMFGGGGDDDTPAMIETPLPMVAEVGRRERLAWEKEAIGVFLSDHPFIDAARYFDHPKYTVTSAISADIADKQVTIAGIVASVRRITTRKGDTMAVATLEDLYGSVEVVGFPRTFQETAELWQEDAILVIQGKVDARDDRLQIIAEGLETWNPAGDMETVPDDEVVVFQPTVVVAPTAHRAWRPAKSAEHGTNGNGSGYSNGNGSSNGHSNGNGSRATAPELVVRRLRIVVNRTDNDNADEKLLSRLSHLLQDEGASPYEVVVVLPEGRFRVSHPDSRVRLTVDLERQLREDFGAECVVVDRV
jgi:DNA polymerase-3 subunit alpha